MSIIICCKVQITLWGNVRRERYFHSCYPYNISFRLTALPCTQLVHNFLEIIPFPAQSLIAQLLSIIQFMITALFLQFSINNSVWKSLRFYLSDLLTLGLNTVLVPNWNFVPNRNESLFYLNIFGEITYIHLCI